MSLKKARLTSITKRRMVGSRHLQGNVLTRIRSLLRSGALKRKPVWVDVVEAFPPLTEAAGKPEPGRPPTIILSEDEIKERFQQYARDTSISGSTDSAADVAVNEMLETFKRLMQTGRFSEDSAFENACENFKKYNSSSQD